MSDQDKILQFLRISGPTLPTKVAKHLNTPLLLASAGLADLSSQGKVKVSKLKIGGSPLYYLPGQEERLYHFAAGNVDPKDFRVLEQLQQEKVLRESALDLLSKVALRHLPDFALPLQVGFEGNSELFWKWHLLSEEETREKIQNLLVPKKEIPEEVLLKEDTPANFLQEVQASESPVQKKLVEEYTEEREKIENVNEPEGFYKEKTEKPRKKEQPLKTNFSQSLKIFLQS